MYKQLQCSAPEGTPLEQGLFEILVLHLTSDIAYHKNEESTYAFVLE